MPRTTERRRRRALPVAVAVALALALVARGARAEPVDEVDQPSLRAEKLAADADARAASGAYPEAIELYLQASQAAPAAVLAFDIAWIYDQHLGAQTLALDYYRKSLAAPDIEPALAARASERIAAIEAAARASGTRLAPPVTNGPRGAAEDTSSWSAMKTWALVAGGAGVVALGIGATFALVAKSKDNEAQQYCDGDRCTDARALTLTDDATSAARKADFAIVTGAVLVAGGVTLWLLAPKTKSVGVSVRGPSLVVGGTW